MPCWLQLGPGPYAGLDCLLRKDLAAFSGENVSPRGTKLSGAPHILVNTIQAAVFSRRMRGSSQAVLLEASNGKEYVVKSPNNPNGLRTLVNEWLGFKILKEMKISSPDIRPINISDVFLQECPEMYLMSGSGRRIPLQSGIHLASEYVGNGNNLVHDFLPAPLMRTVANIRDFTGVLVMDKWLANTDARQCVFSRAERKGTTGRMAYMIDHGQLLDGNHWEFRDSKISGLYVDRSVYAGVESWDSFEPWFERLNRLDGSYFAKVIHDIPREWIEDDRLQFNHIVERLIHRRREVARLIEEVRESSTNPFPNWTTRSQVSHTYQSRPASKMLIMQPV